MNGRLSVISIIYLFFRVAVFADGAGVCNAQIKEAAQLAALNPAVLVIYSNATEHF